MMWVRVLVIVASLWAAPASATNPGDDLVAAMQAGGTVVYLRHAATVASQVDTGRLGDRAGQRNLSEAGRAQAAALGDAFRDLGIVFDRILASPVYRARDTAELAFGADAIEVTMDIVADDYAGSTLGHMLEATWVLLASPPPGGDNLLLVGHRTPLEMVLRQPFPDTVLPEGAMAVFVGEGEASRLLGTLSADDLIAAAVRSATGTPPSAG